VTLNELHDRIRATRPSAWHLLPPGPEELAAAEPEVRAPRHHHRAVLRHDVDVVLEWGMRESSLEYYEPWIANVVRKGGVVQVERILLDVLYRGSLVDRLRGLAVADVLLPFPRSRNPRVKGLADRFFPRAEAEVWALVNAVPGEGERGFDRVVFDSGLRVE
jgi:hypothetical protein